jgi:GT2 family glycosyltransferase
MDLSVIIVSYNVKDRLAKNLEIFLNFIKIFH